MSEADVELVARMFREFVNRDPSDDESWRVARDLLDPDFEYSEDPDWPGSSTYHGVDAFEQVVRGYAEAFREMRLDAEEIIDAGDRVLVLIHWWARGESGVEAVMDQAGIFTVRDGRVASWQVIFDRDRAFEAVGLSR